MKTTYRTAVHDGLHDALSNDPRVVLMGEDVGRYGGTYAASKGLLEEFGPERVRDTPLSELGFVGIGIGAALNGLRPIVEVMTVISACWPSTRSSTPRPPCDTCPAGSSRYRSWCEWRPAPDVSWRRSTHTAWSPGMPTSRGSRSSPPPRSRMPTECSPPRWLTRIR